MYILNGIFGEDGVFVYISYGVFFKLEKVF